VNQDTQQRPEDFDGCHIACRTTGQHTNRYGHCAQAPKPEPSVSMSVIVTEPDGSSFIGFDTYTTQGLADIIEPALRNVRIHLGPNSLAAIRSGNILTLTSGEVRSLALEAAHAIIHRNNT
jgi:hypothetical protein